MKLLSGKDIATYIMERQARQVRALRQSHGTVPKLAIVYTKEQGASATYMAMKQRYGRELGILVELHFIPQEAVMSKIATLNADKTVHGIIVQLPLADVSQTDEVINAVAPDKDVDGLGNAAQYDPATPTAVLWLLAGYNVDLPKLQIVLVGRGRLVGKPLEAMFAAAGYNYSVIDRSTADIAAEISEADVVIAATGEPGLITPSMLKRGAVVVDAGVAGEKGKTVGDLAPEVYERDDLIVTPQKGGVGPLTICALFDNLIRAAGTGATRNTQEPQRESQQSESQQSESQSA